MRTTSTTWALALTAWLAYLRAAGRAPATIRLRTHYVSRLARDLDGDPWAVTFNQLCHWLARPGWSPETRKSARASVRAFYGWAVDADLLDADRNPARRLPVITSPRPAARPAPTTVLQLALGGATDRDRLMLMLAGYAGLRRGEITRVHPDDIDRDRGMLRVVGKGGHVRAVPLHPELLCEIDAELERRDVGQHGTGWRYTSGITAGGHLFPGVRGGPCSVDVPGKVLARLLGGTWTGHTLRHRFATMAYSAERDLLAVQDLLGHAKPETTRRYVQTPPDAMRAAVAAVGVDAA